MTDPQLLIPVYLNQRTVFDLLAMMQNGISRVTTLTMAETTRESADVRLRARFGLSQALASLLRIDLTAQAGAAVGEEDMRSTSEERVHTPASLLYKLREMLLAKKAVSQDAPGYQPAVGQFVEFRTTLRRNPLVESLDTMVNMVEVWAIFFGESRGKQQKGQPAGSEMRKIKTQMEAFRDSLKAGGTVDILGESLLCGHDSVITLEEEFLSDPTMADLVDGQFTVLGKVVRVVANGGNSISLIRKAAMGAMSPPALDEVFSHFQTAAAEGNFRLPPPKWQVEGPAFQVLPIAIYA